MGLSNDLISQFVKATNDTKKEKTEKTVYGKIVDDNGEEIKPTGRFLISAETIDPYHLVVDMF